mgnify:CR=1 FL=1
MKKLVLLSRLFDEGRALLEGKVQLEEHFCDDPMQGLDAIKDADGIILGNQKLGASVKSDGLSRRLQARSGCGYRSSTHIFQRRTRQMNMCFVLKRYRSFWSKVTLFLFMFR